MPPPPPSASYLLVLDDSDDESECESDDDFADNAAVFESTAERSEKKKEEEVVVRSHEDMLAKIKADLAKATGLSVEEIDRMRARKKSVGEASMNSCESKEEGGEACLSKEEEKKKKKKKRKKKKKSNKAKKSVSFGVVSVREYNRAMGEDGVPADGGWPLGLGPRIVSEYTLPGSALDFEKKRQQELQQRYQRITKQTPQPNSTLETRQFDYKKVLDPSTNSTKNPLFGPLHEDQREKILSKHLHHLTSCSIRHVRNELEQIRVHRSHEGGNQGCTCRKIHVHLPSATNNSHKKSKHHRRMPERKLKEELRKRSLYSSKHNCTRDELEQQLYDAVQNEPCCWNDDCPCVKSGIGCQADTCSCWHPGHDNVGGSGHSSPKNSESNTPEIIRTKCGNKNGMYVVDFDMIYKYRCQFITN
uniref:Cysteine/serine-rich nuclear protein N-terminal domain-containing protein n=1 Tax=Ditylum brightwellii TaxID=49249 RepID=A0A7S4SCU6_9STRA